ncbi:uncharacterized oxidoreductase TM_0325-like [Sitodiplosis mosellana]|uniref:uncharacterized oxidoreductase TM_0325-like n=1 Tax=Sitodiplosis mosellana TaxID=263140 RepID=UPI002444CB55|nr:uncharacterized oxidoreductase TM_0325-like [Sitodiplosis mosellana]
MSFKDKVVIVTGASSGIGRGAAIHLAKLAADVVLVGRNQERLNEVKQQIIANGSSEPLVLAADVTKDSEKIINESVKHFGKINVLINNAGMMTEESIENVTMEAFDKTIDVNLRSVVQLTQKAIPYLEQTKGNILNVSSTAGLKAVPNLLSYCVSKAALDQLTKCSALNLAPKGIRVNAINPAAIRTPLYKALGIDSKAEQELFDSYKSHYPMGRIGEVSDTSSAIAYLTGDSASFLTGVLLPVDGGALTAGYD